MLLIKNATIFTAVDPKPISGDLLIENGRIVAIGPQLSADGAEVFNASGLNVYPGFIDAHCHIGLDGYGIGYEGSDYNEYNDPVTPHLRAIDGIEPTDPTFAQAAAAGVTTVCTGPGSSNVIGGTFVAMKTIGVRVDDMVINPRAAMKCAFGENPKGCYRQKNITSRMTVAAMLRETIMRAFEYNELRSGDKKPAFDMKLEAMLPVVRREIPLKAHAHRCDDIFTAIRIAKEFDLKLTLEHCTEGHLIADILAAEGYPLAVGPSLTHATKFELRNKSFETPGILARAGAQVSIITDSTVVPQQYLSTCAGLAVKSGMDHYAALRAITINPARHIGVADRVGSLEVGKDADIVICRGDALDPMSQVVQVFIEGKKVTAPYKL